MHEPFLASAFSTVLLFLAKNGGIENALRPLYQALQEKIPLDFLHLYQLLEKPDGHLSLAILGYVDEYGAERQHLQCEVLDLLTSPALREQYFSPESSSPLIQGNLLHDPVTGAIGMALFPEFSSVLNQYLCFKENAHYFLSALAYKPNAFTEKDGQILANLKEPCALFCEKFVVRNKNILSSNQIPPQQYTPNPFSDDPIQMLRACQAMPDVLRFAQKAAQSQAPVLILGETGVGKEVVADAIHALSTRSNAPYIKINCGALPESLIDNELFGHERGSFTGAFRQTQGYFEQAHGGTLLLDEVGDLPQHTQIRLLRVLDRREVQKVGGSIRKGLNVRIIAATNANLTQLVAENKFRKDLYYRLCTLSVSIPPLRKRREDIPILTLLLWEERARTLNLTPAPPIPENEMLRLLLYPWPGNVRELNAVLDRAMLDYVTGSPIHFILQEAPKIFRNIAQVESTPPTTHKPLIPLKQLQAEHMAEALLQCGKINGPGGAAEMLGIHPSTLRARMKKLGVKN